MAHQGSNKNANNLTDEQLLELLDAPVQIQNELSDYSNEVSVYNFVVKFNIKKGVNTIPLSKMFELHKLTSNNPLLKKESEFKQELEKYIPISKNNLCYINQDIMNIHKELLLKQVKGFVKKRNTENIEQFIQEYNLREDGEWIKGSILFTLFKKKHKKAKEGEFYHVMSLFFEKKTNDNIWFKVSYNDPKKKKQKEE